MAVRVFLTSGERRVVPEADGARMDGEYFLITRWYDYLRRSDTVLTLWATQVVGAQIERDGVVTEYVPGAGRA